MPILKKKKFLRHVATAYFGDTTGTDGSENALR